MTELMNSFTDRFIALLEDKAPRPLSIPEMARMLDLDRYEQRTVKAVLEGQVAEGRLRRIGKTRYQWLRDVDKAPRATAASRTGRGRAAGGSRREQSGPGRRVEGRYTRVRAGYGFVEALGRDAARFPRDILIPAGSEGDALHGDRVAVAVKLRDRRAGRTAGEVVAVIDRAHECLIGKLERTRKGWVLVPDNELLPPVELLGDTLPRPDEAGLVARVRLTRPPSPNRWPGGVLDGVLGPADDPDVQFLSIAGEHGLRVEFPPEVLDAAGRCGDEPAARDLAGREDLRALPFVTIDGEMARDFDDAVCLEPAGADGHRLRVAIADVSHYVTPGSPLDAEAARRGTSVYFPDRAIPMLPPRLSNGLCSLNPERDRLVLVAEMTYDAAGHRRDARFYRGVMRSRARLTYTQVAAVLSETDTPEVRAWRTTLAPLLPQLHRMRALMQVFNRNRVQAGSLDLDLPEALVDLSEAGRSIGVRLLERNDAHRLIEEFMLEANRAVATFLADRHVPLPYRVHEAPSAEAIDELNRFLGPFGLHVRYEGRPRPQDVQRLLDRLEGHRLARVLSRQVLRSLTQAQYSTTNVGHFGLAFPLYCHFTSPIRRYPDLLVHRQLGLVFDGHADVARAQAEALEGSSVRSSQAERQAMEAERAMLDLKKAEFMLEHLLEPEPATIVSITPYGFYVELDAYPVEGLVRSEALTDDRYRYIEAEQALCGARRRQRYRLGDRLVVEATNVSLERRQIDFTVLRRLGEPTPELPPRPKQSRRQPPGRRQNRRSRKS